MCYPCSEVCSGSVVVTAYDSESGCPGSNPEWGGGRYTMRLQSLHRAYPLPSDYDQRSALLCASRKIAESN